VVVVVVLPLVAQADQVLAAMVVLVQMWGLRLLQIEVVEAAAAVLHQMVVQVVLAL
jgi:hypothetical protein